MKIIFIYHLNYLLFSLKINDDVVVIQIIQEWKFVSMVLDRFLLWVFTLSCIGGTLGIIFQSPSLYDNRKSLALELSEIKIQSDGGSPLDLRSKKQHYLIFYHQTYHLIFYSQNLPSSMSRWAHHKFNEFYHQIFEITRLSNKISIKIELLQFGIQYY